MYKHNHAASCTMRGFTVTNVSISAKQYESRTSTFKLS